MSRQKVVFEYYVRSSPSILYSFLTTPEGLSQWFADHVDSFENEYTFYWDGSSEQAELLDCEEDEFVRYRMEDCEDDEYIEFRIGKTEIGNDTMLYITKFLNKNEVADEKLFWDITIDKLMGSIGGKN